MHGNRSLTKLRLADSENVVSRRGKKAHLLEGSEEILGLLGAVDEHIRDLGNEQLQEGDGQQLQHLVIVHLAYLVR